MISEKQLLANRSNCLKSTGPQSPQGKRTVSRNAVRHGLLSNSDEILIHGENQDEFDSFRQNLRDDLRPSGQLETLLTERITGFFWKLKRAGRMEKGLLEILCNPSSNSDATDKKKELPFVMITTKTYAAPSDDPEFQEFKKRKQQQTAACGLDPSKGMVSPETFESTRLLGTRESRPDNNTEASSSETLGRAVSRDFKDGRLLERLLTYEGRIERSLYKALAELQKFQFIRRRKEEDLDQAEVAPNDLNDTPMDSRGITPDGVRTNKAISNDDQAEVLHDNNDQNKLAGNTGHPESPLRGEGSVDSISSNKSACPRTSLSGAKSAVPVPLDTPETNKAILIPCQARNHPPKPSAEGGVDNSICRLHAVRRSTCGCLG
jgi:hypothetical protein